MKTTYFFTFILFLVILIPFYACKQELKESFTSGSFNDNRDGHRYNWVKIGDQVWMAENLAYLPAVSSPNESSLTESLFYVNDYYGTNIIEAKTTSNYIVYGVLYNWPSAMNGATTSSSVPSGVQGICPNGWHLPSNDEWIKLIEYLGGEFAASDKLKEAGFDHWIVSPDIEANNSSGFTALPGGCFLDENYLFDPVGYACVFWSATAFEVPYSDFAFKIELFYSTNNVAINAGYYKSTGRCVRCLKDN